MSGKILVHICVPPVSNVVMVIGHVVKAFLELLRRVVERVLTSVRCVLRKDLEQVARAILRDAVEYRFFSVGI